MWKPEHIYAFNRHNRDRWVARQAAVIRPGQRVLDAGAGTGRYRHLFSHCEYRAHDFGREPETIGNYTALDYESDILSIPVPDASFDIVLCTEVLEHVPRPIETVYELARIIRPGGRLLLTALLGSFLHQEPYHYYGGYTPHWYTLFLPQAGLSVETIVPNEGFFSWFGQEGLRFSAILKNRRSLHGWQWFVCSFIYVGTLPLMAAFPLLGRLLDRFGLEKIATVGYHVVAVKPFPNTHP